MKITIKKTSKHRPHVNWRVFAAEFLRAIRIFKEYVRGFYMFHNIYDCVTVFGSARFDKLDKFYATGYELGKLLAENKFAVMTGGGPGIMEAVNRGAQESGGLSIGCNIELPEEQESNNYLDKCITFHYFSPRKMILTKYSAALIVMPGGLGTLDELCEMATLRQTKKISDTPIVLIGSEYWQPLKDFFKDVLLAHNTIDPQDVDMLFITDSPQQAIDYIKERLNK